MKRVFLALPLAPVFQNDVSVFLEKMKAKITNIRWIQPEQLHFTLRFFGSMEETDREIICGITKEIAARTSPFQLQLSELGFFPRLESPVIVWLGPKTPVPALMRLQQELEKGFKAAGFSGEERPFTPHATLGRLKRSKRAVLDPALPHLETAVKTFHEIVLFESHLDENGPRYEVIETFPFAQS